MYVIEISVTTFAIRSWWPIGGVRRLILQHIIQYLR